MFNELRNLHRRHLESIATAAAEVLADWPRLALCITSQSATGADWRDWLSWRLRHAGAHRGS